MEEVESKDKMVAVIVAHPDDETLWAGGTLLEESSWQVFIASLCRMGDQDRAEKFRKALAFFNAEGKMNDLDDGPEQRPLSEKMIRQKILSMLPHKTFDLILTHAPDGEYTRHRRHEEIGRVVIKLWKSGKLRANELWTFAYEDGNRGYYPRAKISADLYHELSAATWQKKYNIITGIYGFDPESWEARTTPKCEAFQQFTSAEEAFRQLTSDRERVWK